MTKYIVLENDIFNSINLKEGIRNNWNEKDDFLFDNYIFESFEFNYGKKIEIDSSSFKVNKKIEVESTNNKQKLFLTKLSQNKDKNSKTIFIIKKERNKVDISNEKNRNKYSPFEIEKKEEEKKMIRFIGNKYLIRELNSKLYRKDYYYKHFKALFGKYLKNKLNSLKNKCFPSFIFNNFSTPNYSFTGNAKELDNYHFLSYYIKDILVYKEKKNKGNNQTNNKLLIEYILNNETKSKDERAYQELITLLNNKLEIAFTNFYEDKIEFKKVSEDEDCIYYDKFFRKETGISLLENNGFLKAIQKNVKNINI